MDKRTFGAAAILAVLTLVSTHLTADASLYRWKDAQGNTVMSDRPPPVGTPYEAISTDSSVVRRVEGEAPPQQIVPKPKAEPETPAPAPTKTVYEKNPEYCENARKNLEVIGRAPRIRMPDENGDMRYITDEEREAEKQKNLEIVEIHCE